MMAQARAETPKETQHNHMKTKLTKLQWEEVKSLIEDSGYTRAEAIAIVLAGGLG